MVSQRTISHENLCSVKAENIISNVNLRISRIIMGYDI